MTDYYDEGYPIPEPEETEQEEVLRIFGGMLAGPTGDGKKKREAGTKPLWKVDPGHEAAMYRHLDAWEGTEWINSAPGVAKFSRVAAVERTGDGLDSVLPHAAAGLSVTRVVPRPAGGVVDTG